MEGYNQLVAACDNITLRGMAVHTNTAKMREMRKTNLQFMLTHHDTSCTSCLRSGNCTLQTLAQQFGIHTQPYKKQLTGNGWNQDFPLIREPDKYVQCLRRIQICNKVPNSSIWNLKNRTNHTAVDTTGGASIEETDRTL